MDEGEQKDKQSINERERAVLQFWRTHDIFEKSLAQNEGKTPYVFYDGPPFATGLPHHGHLLQSTIKDIIPRFQTMRGRYVRREWGWDCHGLPIENMIEKELGLKQKSDIEAYGVGAFNQKAKESVLTYDMEWKSIVPRMGRWVDMENAYKTMDPSYTESVWWSFKTLYEKKLIYEGFKSMHICPRCETTLAASEVTLNYKDIKDISVYVKFALVDEPKTSLIAWTTTPWTLPGNVAVAVGPNIAYEKITFTDGEHKGETYIIAKERVAHTLGKASIATDADGKLLYVSTPISADELIGKKYTPIFDYYVHDKTLENRENAWTVVGADFVTTDSGTGIVHEAPAFGEEDMELAKKLKLPMIQHVGMNGVIKKEVTDFAGLQAKPKDDHTATDVAVIKVLAQKGVLFAKEKIEHSYPHCWRCDTPLLNYAASSWFVNVTALKPRLIAENSKISWIPENIRDGRFGKWIDGARDWAISRSRYWGAPLPVWKCAQCDRVDAVGSIHELSAKIGQKNSYTVIRHGEAESNVRAIVSYKLDDNFHLTEKGRAQAKASATKLKGKGIDLIIASPVLRTKETATIVAETIGINPADIVFDQRIAEVNTGDFSNCSIETYRSYFTTTLEKFSKPTPGGETLEDMRLRIAEFLYEIDVTYKGKNILLVTHEYGTWMMEAVMRGATNEEAAWMRFEEGEDFIDHAETRPLPFVSIPHNARYELDFHRPFIDAVSYSCACGGGKMSRIPDVFDCWYESGSMPYAQFHYMGDETTPEGKLFVKNFPADFIAEAVDQTRGWFYTMLILSVGLFDRSAFKSVITTGLLLAEDGAKMSKKLKNYPDPMEIVAKYGADALRFYMINSPVVRGEELRFALLGVDEVFKKITMRLDNVRAFLELYAGERPIARGVPSTANVLDKWIIARWYELHAEVTHHLDTHELDRATRPIMPFLDDLSTWYIRRSRDRFKGEEGKDRHEAIDTTGWILFQFARLIAPIMPFIAEDLYQRLHVEGKKESVHLESWPEVGVAASNILEEMERARSIVEIALAIRAEAGLKVRQPLAMLLYQRDDKKPLHRGMESIIMDEVNVKEVMRDEEIYVTAENNTAIRLQSAGGVAVGLNTELSLELQSEGALRDLIRTVQDLRKKAGLHPSDRIVLTVAKEHAPLVTAYSTEISDAVGATDVGVGHTLSIEKK
jgi:isoleucyl-tRNA synthetase